MSSSQGYTKSQIAAQVAEDQGVSKKQANAIIDGFFAYVAGSLGSGYRVSITGIGVFVPKPKAATSARTAVIAGSKVKIKAKPATTVVKFRAAKALKETVGKKR